jgi:hypothetical protein
LKKRQIAADPAGAEPARERWFRASEGLVAEGLLARTATGFRVPRGERARTDAIVLLLRERAEA